MSQQVSALSTDVLCKHSYALPGLCTLPLELNLMIW
jgi:hypothetical protein